MAGIAKKIWTRKQTGSLAAALAALAVIMALVLWPGDAAVTVEPPGAALAAAAQGLDEITVKAAFDPEQKTLDGVQTMQVTNRFSQSVQELVLRTYANAFLTEDTSPAAIEALHESCYFNGFSPGGIVVQSLSVGGAEKPVAYRDQAKTVLVVPLDTPLLEGETVTVTLSYRITIPQCRYRFGYSGNTFVLGNALPILAAFDDGAFREEEYYPIGDPFVSDCANWRVTVSVPEGYMAVGTGHPEKSGQAYAFNALAVRDFALVLSDEYALKSARAGNVTVLSYAKTQAQAQKALDTVTKALTVYSEKIGSYPYPSLTIAQADLAFSGMEYPAMMLLSRAYYQDNDDALEWTAAHETAHQWFYAVVGSDQYNEPWQDEALCEYLVYEYLGSRRGENARQDAIFRKAEASMRVTVPRGVTPGSPVEYFGEMSEYSLVVYDRGAALLTALEEAYGRDTLLNALRAYYERFMFKRATRQDFENTLTDVTGRDYSELIVDYLDTHIIN